MDSSSIAKVAGVDMEVQLAGKTYKISPLQLGDFGRAENHIRTSRLNLFLEQTRGINGVNLPPEVRSKAMAEIISAPIHIAHIIGNHEGQLFLAWCSLSRGQGVSIEYLRNLPGDELLVIAELVLRLSGVDINLKESDSDPLERTDTTSTTIP